MGKEQYNLVINDPAGMGWLELLDRDRRPISELLSVCDVATHLRYTFCEKCDNYYECGGIQNITEPYNILERIDSKGDNKPITHDCLLNGQIIKLNLIEYY